MFIPPQLYEQPDTTSKRCCGDMSPATIKCAWVYIYSAPILTEFGIS